MLSTLIQPSARNSLATTKDPASQREQREEASSFRWALAVWLLWLWERHEQELYLHDEEKRRLWRRMLGSLLHGDAVFVPVLLDAAQLIRSHSIRRLYSSLLRVDPSLQSISVGVDRVLPELSDDEELVGLEDDVVMDKGDMKVDEELEAMEKRLMHLESKVSMEKTIRVWRL